MFKPLLDWTTVHSLLKTKELRSPCIQAVSLPAFNTLLKTCPLW